MSEAVTEARNARVAADDIHGRRKAIHKRARSLIKSEFGAFRRYQIFAWAYIRGLPFRRVEGRHRIQRVGGKPADKHGRIVAHERDAYVHNMPDVGYIVGALIKAGACEGEERWGYAMNCPAAVHDAVRAWLQEYAADGGER